jgi:hypothetical protein
MNRKALVLAFAASFVLAHVGRLAAEDKPAVRTISSSGQTTAGSGKSAYGVSGTSLMSRDGRPIACYGITKAKGEAEKYAYFIVFKSPAEVGKQVEFLMGGRTSMADKIEAKESPTVVLGDRKWSFRYKLEANGDLTKVTTETLTIDDKENKTSDVRVFLVDLTQEKPTCQALKIEPPKTAPDLGEKNDAIKVIEEAVEDLKKRSKEVREFLESAKK